MTSLTVDRSRCVQCGLCVSVCPRGLIRLDEDWPRLTFPQLCIACGHCVAVCPPAALDHSRAPLARQDRLPNSSPLPPATVRQFLRSRRSIRSYQNRPVERALLRQLLDIARFAPSGGNSQGISYYVMDRPATLRRLTERTIDWLGEAAAGHQPAAAVYSRYVDSFRLDGCDSILRNAPVLVLGAAPAGFARGRENTLLCLEYAELYAPSLGLGTCWAGLLEAAAFAGYAPLLELLRLPAGTVLTGALMVGFPNLSFPRLVDRQPLDITFVEA
ncbi:MAG: 4Fe-4S binding protein [Veillonellaceae bacterium]|nr:4Fe-4S binding protein [Veillonellaceae bacterium]